MSTTIKIAPVRKSLVVSAAQAHAFEVFTKRLDAWWPKTHGIGELPIQKSLIEPRKGGRWYTTHADGSETVVGHMLVWEPPHRIVFSWEVSAAWKPDPSVASEVEVRFVVQDPRTTRIELEHRKFEAMGTEDGKKMRGSVDGGWPGLLELFKKQLES